MTERMIAKPVQKDITTALRDLDQTQAEIRSKVVVFEQAESTSLKDRRPYFVR